MYGDIMSKELGRARFGRYSLLALAAPCAALVAGPHLAAAKTASAEAGSRWFLKSTNSDSASSWFETSNTWIAAAKITWSLPTATLNGVAVATAPLPLTENKYLCLAIPCAGKVFTGYTYSMIVGTSSITSSGTGDSGGPPFNAFDFAVQVGGTGDYRIKAQAKDPLNIYPVDLSGLTSYSTFLPFSMSSGSLQPLGSGVTSSGYDFQVDYTTSGGTSPLLNVDVSDLVGTGLNVTVTPSSAFSSSQLLFYQESSLDLDLSGSAATPGTKIGNIVSFIEGDIASDGSLIAPLDLGIVLSGIAAPTTLISDGSGAVAQLDIGETAFELGVPEASTWAMMLIGFAGLGYAAYRKTKSAPTAVAA